MPRRLRALALAAAAAAGLTAGGCGSVKEDLGLAKKAPDEFAVVRNAPLSLPPDFNLRPPKPGEVGEGRLEQRDRARNLLVGQQPGSARAVQAELTAARPAAQPASYSFVAGRGATSLGELGEYRLGGASGVQLASAGGAGGFIGGRGERALLSRLDALDADPTIRQQVDQEAKLLAADDRNLVEQMMFWRDLNPPGVLVNAPAERRRINENAALGRPVTDGETPEIHVERLSSGLSLF